MDSKKKVDEKKFKIGYFIKLSKEISSSIPFRVVHLQYRFSIQYSNNQFNGLFYTYSRR